MITVAKAEDEDMVSKLIKACFKDISNVKLIDGKVKDYSQTLNHIKNDKNSFYDNIWFQTFGLGKNGSEIQFFKFAHEDSIYQSETCWVPDEPIKSLVKLNNLTK